MTNLSHILSNTNTHIAKDLARSYNILHPYKVLKSVLQSVMPNVNLEAYSKFDIHSIFNEIIIKYYYAETLYKSRLVDYFIEEDIIAGFEVRTNKSRLDFLKLNGYTISYEIKSEVDNLAKIEKQILDYSKLFDYNNVVIGRNHLSAIRTIIPDGYGIIVIDGNEIEYIRKPGKNTKTDIELQLNVFTKKELRMFFKVDDKKEIILSFNASRITEQFRAMLKKRYEGRWDFIKLHKNSILPIDYQYFFNHNILPSVIYDNGN